MTFKCVLFFSWKTTTVQVTHLGSVSPLFVLSILKVAQFFAPYLGKIVGQTANLHCQLYITISAKITIEWIANAWMLNLRETEITAEITMYSNHLNPWGQFLVNCSQNCARRPHFWPLFLVKKLSARKWQIFIDIYGLVQPKIKSWVNSAIVDCNFQEIDPWHARDKMSSFYLVPKAPGFK